MGEFLAGWIVVIVLWIACAIGCAYIARGKGYDVAIGAITGLAFGLVAVIVFALLPKKTQPQFPRAMNPPPVSREKPASEGKPLRCGYCKQPLPQAGLAFCPHCGHQFGHRPE